MADVVVIGAGPAGLSAALDAAEAGHRCTVVEASGAVGGMAGSFEFAGQRVDYGSHRLHLALGDRQRARFERLLGDDLQVRPRNGRIRLRDRWIGFPLRTWDLLTHVPPSFGLRVATDIVTNPLRRTPADPTRHTAAGRLRRTRGMSLDHPSGPSFDTEVRARLGHAMADEFYGPYARKLYGIEPVELDAELAHRRVSATSGTDIVRRVIRAARPIGRQFLYPRRGYGQLSEALADAAVRAGVDLRLNTPATRITLDADGAAVAIERRPTTRSTAAADASAPAPAPSTGAESASPQPDTADTKGSDAASAGGRTAHRTVLEADAVLSTAPVPILAEIVEPAPPAEVTEALARCRTRAMLLVYLAVPRDQYTPFDAHYFPETDTRVARLSEPKNYRDGDDPADQTVLCAEIACWPDDDLWRSHDDQLAELVIEDLERTGQPPPDPSASTVRRLPSVYPVLESTTKTDRATVNAWITSLAPNGLLSFGRQGLTVLDNLHHVLDMGTHAASALTPDGIVETDRWQAALSRFAQHVVED